MFGTPNFGIILYCGVPLRKLIPPPSSHAFYCSPPISSSHSLPLYCRSFRIHRHNYPVQEFPSSTASTPVQAPIHIQITYPRPQTTSCHLSQTSSFTYSPSQLWPQPASSCVQLHSGTARIYSCTIRCPDPVCIRLWIWRV